MQLICCTTIMKIKTWMIVVTFCGTALLATHAKAQDSSELSRAGRTDSLADARGKQIRDQKTTDDQTLSDLKHDRADTKRQAKDAQRVEDNASNSAKASKAAYKTEKKAQKARRRADGDAKKAARAKEKTQ